MSNSYRDMAKKIVGLERGVEAARAPQLIHSTIEGGAVSLRDDTGQLTGIVGQAYDGTYGSFSLAGPTPPTPTQPDVTPVPGGVLVRVPGTWTDAPVAPMDFGRWEVYASTEPVASAIFPNFKTDLTSPRGGEVSLSLERDTDFWIWVAARTSSGKIGAPSALVGPIRAGKAVESDLDIDWETLGGNTIFYTEAGDPEPVTDKIGDLWLEETDPGPPASYVMQRWTGTGWSDLQDQAVVEAALAAAAAQEAVELRAQYFAQPDEPTGLTSTDKAIWTDTNDGNITKSWTGSAWVSRKLGNGAIQPNSLVASDVLVTGTVTAALLEAIMILATTIVLGPVDGTHAELTPTGIRFFSEDPTDGTPNLVGNLGGPGADFLGLNDTNGRQVAGIDQTGRLIGQGLSINSDPVFQGRPLVGDLLWNLPWGRVATSVDIPLVGPHTVEQGVFEMGFTAQPGRQYEIRSTPIALRNETVPTRGVLALRYTTNGASPNLSSPVLTISTTQIVTSAFPWENPSNSVSGTYRNDTNAPLQIRILLTVNTFGGGGVHFFKEANVPWLLYINDMGPALTGVGQTNNLRADGSSTAPPPATSPPQDRVFSWLATWTRSWNENGSVQADGIAYQGYYPGNGNTRSMIGFDAMSPTLAGSQITRIELYLYFNHWYFNSGGTAIIGAHGAAGTPGAWSRLGDPLVFSSGWPKGAGRWVDLPLSWAAGFANGNIKGITLGPGADNNQIYYGRADGSSSPANKPTLRISYRK